MQYNSLETFIIHLLYDTFIYDKRDLSKYIQRIYNAGGINFDLSLKSNNFKKYIYNNFKRNMLQLYIW